MICLRSPGVCTGTLECPIFRICPHRSWSSTASEGSMKTFSSGVYAVFAVLEVSSSAELITCVSFFVSASPHLHAALS